jgi:hypothetical protein
VSSCKEVSIERETAYIYNKVELIENRIKYNIY